MVQLLAQHTAAGSCKAMLQHQPCLLLHNCGMQCLSDIILLPPPQAIALKFCMQTSYLL